jgi:hypothetical protein
LIFGDNTKFTIVLCIPETKKFPGEKVETNPVVTTKKTIEVSMIPATKTVTKPVGSKKVPLIRKVLIAYHPEYKTVGKKEVLDKPGKKTVTKPPNMVDIKKDPFTVVLRHPATPQDVEKQPAQKVIRKKPKEVEIVVKPIVETRTTKPDVEKVEGLKMVAPRLFASIYPFLHVFPYGGVPLPLHVVFVIDNSKDMMPTVFNYVRRFLDVLLHKERPEWKNARFGVVTTATPQLLFGLSPTKKAKGLLPKLKHVKGVPNLSKALQLALDHHKTYPERHAKKVAFVISANSPSYRSVSVEILLSFLSIPQLVTTPEGHKLSLFHNPINASCAQDLAVAE